MNRNFNPKYNDVKRISIKYDGLRDNKLYTFIYCNLEGCQRIDVNDIATVIGLVKPINKLNDLFFKKLVEFDLKINNSTRVCMFDFDFSDNAIYKFIYIFNNEWQTHEFSTSDTLMEKVFELEL